MRLLLLLLLLLLPLLLPLLTWQRLPRVPDTHVMPQAGKLFNKLTKMAAAKINDSRNERGDGAWEAACAGGGQGAARGTLALQHPVPGPL
jgi:hypothetical protein